MFVQAQVCTPDVNSCAFYVCQEKQQPCGPRGYPLGFGFKFCQIFLDTEQTYSVDAHAWLRRVRVCLMDSMNELSENGPRSCKQIKDEGFRSHLGCYVDTGFCELSFADQWVISWSMRTSFVHPEVIRDGVAVMQACSSRPNTSYR
ncbi:hypothetical protein [Bdellovibrio sp. HCB337]|uniref:hypothetical protein n=1 Tax=Bdellovibrio sp. HCB337 TaxID=3394358 RepID=UPI0039A47C64